MALRGTTPYISLVAPDRGVAFSLNCLRAALKVLSTRPDRDYILTALKNRVPPETVATRFALDAEQLQATRTLLKVTRLDFPGRGIVGVAVASASWSKADGQTSDSWTVYALPATSDLQLVADDAHGHSIDLGPSAEPLARDAVLRALRCLLARIAPVSLPSGALWCDGYLPRDTGISVGSSAIEYLAVGAILREELENRRENIERVQRKQ